MRKSVSACLVGGLGLLFGGLLAGLVATLLAMIRAFDAASHGGESDPTQLSAGIREAMGYMVISLPIAGAGLFLVVVALVVHFTTRPPKWEEGA